MQKDHRMLFARIISIHNKTQHFYSFLPSCESFKIYSLKKGTILKKMPRITKPPPTMRTKNFSGVLYNFFSSVSLEHSSQKSLVFFGSKSCYNFSPTLFYVLHISRAALTVTCLGFHSRPRTTLWCLIENVLY